MQRKLERVSISKANIINSTVADILIFSCCTIDILTVKLSYTFNRWIFRIWPVLSYYSVGKFSIFSSLNVINWFPLEQRCDLLRQRDNRKKLSFWMNLIFILVGVLISKIAVLGNQKKNGWSYRSQWTHYE